MMMMLMMMMGVPGGLDIIEDPSSWKVWVLRCCLLPAVLLPAVLLPDPQGSKPRC
jgi:hypothetical protein